MKIVRSPRWAAPRIWLEENGPLAATIGIEHTLLVPAFAQRPENYMRGESRRAEETRALCITSWITLKKDARQVDVRTRVDNTVRRSSLAGHAALRSAAEEAAAAGHFTVDRRSVVPKPAADGTFSPEMQTLPMQSFIDISDGRHGLAVLNNCFTEYQAIDGEQTTLAITLFRAMKNIICTEFRSAGVFPDQDGGQLQRTLEYDYALTPHGGDWRPADLFNMARSFATPPTALQVTPHKQGTLPTHASLFALESDVLVFSALKRAEDRDTTILRVFNPSDSDARGTLRFQQSITAAWRTALSEERREALPLAADNTVEITAGPHKIMTLELEISL